MKIFQRRTLLKIEDRGIDRVIKSLTSQNSKEPDQGRENWKMINLNKTMSITRKENLPQVCFSKLAFFVKKKGDKLHEYSTLKADKSLQQMATEMQDTRMMSNIAGGDLVAIQTKYS